MTIALQFACVVVYADDVDATVAFYQRATGLTPSYFDRDLGFALLGADQTLAIASHAAGALMLEGGYARVRGAPVRGTEVAFWADDVAAAFDAAVRAGAVALTPPRLMPWGQTVAYVEAPEGTILGFVTRVPAPPTPRVTSLAPQLLVDDLARSIDYYRRLGFVFGDPWDGFYAIGKRDGLELHLKEAPRSDADRRHRREHEHLDAAAGVDGIEAFYAQCVANGATILRPLAVTAWGTRDFYVEDPDGNVVAFGGRP